MYVSQSVSLFTREPTCTVFFCPKEGTRLFPPPLPWGATLIQIHYTGYSSLVSDLLGVLLII